MTMHPGTGQKSVEWYTPEWVFDELGLVFDLDPCSPADYVTIVPAKKKYTIHDDGLSQSWWGNVWLNPPYGRSTPEWIKRMCKHNNGIAMVFSRTDSRWCQEAMLKCSALLFLAGRVSFIPGHENKHKCGRAGAGTMMFAFGYENAVALSGLRSHGVFIDNS